MSPSRSRRSFLIGGVALGALTDRVFSAEKTTCGFGFGTYGLPTLKLDEAIRLVGETGFDCVEIAVMKGTSGEPDMVSPEDRKNIPKLLKDSDLRLSALMADLTLAVDDAKFREHTDSFRKIIDLGREFFPDRPPLVQTVLGGKDWEAVKHQFRDRLAVWQQIAADQKVILAIKPHRGNAMSNPADAAWLFRQLGGSPWLRMVYDFSHYAWREPEMTIAGTAAESLPWTAYVASKDAVRQANGKVVFALPGEGGAFDHAEIIRSFHAGGYRGDFCCEVSSQIWKAPGYDPVVAIKTAHRNLSAAFERAGVNRG
jgi:sugar phosphate isomerase/epimerase